MAITMDAERAGRIEERISDIRLEQARKSSIDERRFLIVAIGLYTFGGATLLLAIVTLLLVIR